MDRALLEDCKETFSYLASQPLTVAERNHLCREAVKRLTAALAQPETDAGVDEKIASLALAAMEKRRRIHPETTEYILDQRACLDVVKEVIAALRSRSTGATVGVAEGPVWGIIDPDYARVFTISRCIAWAEGYALVMHGSFTRDLDLLAVPWTEGATDAEHLVKRIALALDDLSLLVKDPKAASKASEKPHGRKAWTLTFKTFGDPRFVDLSVMPRLADRERTQP